jgi:outer membrane protein assembly factor BamA
VTARWILRLWMGLAVAWAVAVPVHAQRPEVVDLRFDGARSFTRAELASAIATSATRCSNVLLTVLCWAGAGLERARLETGALEADELRLKVYYYERGFREATVEADTARDGDGVRLTFDIEEGRPVRVTELEVHGAPDELLERPLPMQVGDPFDIVANEASRDTLLARLRNNGFARAQVLVSADIFRDAPYEARLRYDVVPGTATRFGEIRVVGNAEASPELVHRMLTFREGDRYDRSALLRSQRNLYRLQIFRHADVQADLQSEPDSVIPITVQVAEGDMRRVRVGAGLNSVECGTLEGRWTSRNFLGGGRRVEVQGQVGNLLMGQCEQVPLLSPVESSFQDLTGVFSIDFTQPWLFGPRNNVGVGLFAERRNVPQVFTRRAYGGYVSVGRSLGDGAAITLGYRPELTELQTEGNLFFCVNFLACSFEDLADNTFEDRHWLAPVTLSYGIDRTDAVFAPSRGYIVRADVEHAGGYTGSDYAYTRTLLEGSAYGGKADGLVVATRVRGGIAWPHDSGTAASQGLNPQKRFFAGGPNSVRGYDQYRLGPTVLGIDAVPWLARPDEDPDDGVVDHAGCLMQAINDGSCDVSALAADSPNRFGIRPVGGEVVVEGNVELRFPLPMFGGKLRGAMFVDAGQVWAQRRDFELSEITATPGVGLRYYSPIGPIRIDAAFNTAGVRTLTVLSTEVEPCTLGEDPGCDRGVRQTLRNTDNVVRLDPVTFGEPLGAMDSFGDFFDRVRLHFSIGQAF